MRIGIYNRYWNTRGGGERYAGVMAEALSRRYPVDLIGVEPVDVPAMGGHLGLDLSRVEFRQWPKASERGLTPRTVDYDLFINCTYLSKLRSEARHSVYVVLFPQRTWPRGLIRGTQSGLDRLERIGKALVPRRSGPGAMSSSSPSSSSSPPAAGFPTKVRNVLWAAAERVRGRFDAYDPQIVAGYDLLISISEYTRKWVRARWDQPSTVLAPPVDLSLFSAPEPSEKDKVLLSVGRFFHGSHNKKHREMVKVFRDMYDRGDVPEGWEYHLVGNLHRDRSVDAKYFAELQRLTEGYPVRLLIDLPLDRLVEEYRRAFVFWHAAGWGENERRRPEKLEHFGLTTCEAMSSGCIPVVIAKAGQLEIVEPGTSGFLFTNAEELTAHTRKLIRGYGQPWTWDLMHQAQADVQRFGTESFIERLWEILESHQLLRSA